jgi:hypothetical protein
MNTYHMKNSNGIGLKNSDTEISLDITANKNDKNNITESQKYILRSNVSTKSSLNSQNNVEV